jgi:hypothetical protein
LQQFDDDRHLGQRVDARNIVVGDLEGAHR